MASKRKSSTPCMIPVKTMHMRDEVEQDLSCSTRDRDRDSAYPSREGVYGLGYQDLGEPSPSSSRNESQGASSPKDGGTYTCRPCNFETLDLNLFLDHVYSGHPEFRSDPSFHCVDCGVTSAKFEGLALHNARVHPSTVTTTLQLRKKDRKVTVEQTLVPGPGDGLISKESEISITKTPIMRMLKGKSESKRIVISHSMADDSRLEAMSSTSSSKAMEKKDSPTVTVTHVPTIVHNGSTNKVTIPSAIQIVNGSGALPIIKTAVTQVVSVVQNRGLNQHQHSSPTSISPSSVSATSSSGSSKNLPKVMIPLSSIPTYNASMDSSSFLKTSFSKFPYPTKAELCYLTVVTKYPEEQIKIWFTAQRLKQGISWSPEEIEEARRKMFNTIIQTAPSSGHQQHQQSARQQSHHHSAAQQTITVLPASLGAAGIPHILQGSLVGQGGVIVTQPMMANGIQVNSAPVALAVTPKPQSAAKPMMQARPAAALVADKGVSMVVGTVGSSSTLNYTFTSSSSSRGSNSGIISSSSSSGISSNIASSSLNILSSVINAAGALSGATLTSATSSGSGKTIICNNRNASSPLSLTTKTCNANKSTENGKSVANGNKKTAPSPPIAKTNQDATKVGNNGKEGSSNSSTVKNTTDSRSSPDIKISTDSNSSNDIKMDIKTESRSNGASPSPVPIPSPSTTPNTSTTTTSDTAASTATPTTVTASNLSTSAGVAGGGSSKKGGDGSAKAAAASSPSTSSSRSVSSPSLLDPNSLQKKKSQEQLLALKDSFLVNQFPNQDEINRLTSMTGLTVREVRKWFSDRRYHFRNLKGPRTSTGGGDKAAAAGDKKTSADSSTTITTTTTTTTTTGATATGSGEGISSSEAPVPAPAPETPKTPPPTPVSPPQQDKQTTSPTTPSRRPPRPPSPDFTAIRYKEREPHQLVALEASFSVDPDPTSEEVDKLRQETKMTRREIHGWFAERRKRAAVEKKKEEAERAEKEEVEAAAAAMEVGEKKVEGEEKMAVDDPSGESSSSSSQQGKDEKQKEDAPKVNPIKINLKMLKVTESNGKEGEASQPNQLQSDPPKLVPAPTSSPPPIPTSSTPYRGKKTPDQLHALKQAFARTQWPGSPQYDELMAVTGLPRPEVVRWFGDCRYVLKNGQLKWLESYQSMVEEEDFHKANLEVLKEHLEAHGKLEEAQVKELAKSSGLTEDLVRRWFTNRAPLLLAAKKAEEDGGKTEAASTSTTETGTTEAVLEEKEIKEKEKEKEEEEERKKDKEKEPKEKEERKEEEAALGEAQQDQGSTSEEKSEGLQPSPSGDSAKAKADEDETKAADSKTASSDQD
ncbi:zinc fingers and homeoboxes protein 3 isoform X2 [Engraulis encrasicolus]|uniref:zinc fingers and homeoboxes protein 3 isoform X2 n=1 Tax=Engraulis encrasicolus TaxID=184585 RepID=UPI002FD63E74